MRLVSGNAQAVEVQRTLGGVGEGVGHVASPLLSIEATDRGPVQSRPSYSTASIRN
jgi:hypothetical protein